MSECNCFSQAECQFAEALTKLRAESEWQPIETAPKDGSFIDLFMRGSRRPDCRWDAGWPEMSDPAGWMQKYAEECGGIEFRLFDEPTHWMPIPNPPAP